MKTRCVWRAVLCSSLILCCFTLMGCTLFESDRDKAQRFYELGLKALEQGKTEEALLQFRNAIQKNPYHAKAHYELGSLYAQTDKVQLAAMELNLALTQDPDFIEAAELLAKLYFQYGAYSEAIPHLQRLLEQDRKELEIYLLLGNAFVNTGKAQEAQKTLKEAEGAYPMSTDVRVSMARALLLENRVEEARRNMEEAIALEPESVSLRVLLSRFYENIGLYDEAEETLLTVKQQFADAQEGYLALARFYMNVGRLQEAERVMNQALANGLQEPDIFHTLGLIQHREKDFQKALASFQEAAGRFPDDQRSLILLADYYVFLKDLANARQVYEQIADKWPELSPIRSRIAEIYISERDYDQALHQIEEILGHDPQYARGHILRGLVWLRKGESSRAREEFQRARDLEPRSGEGDYFYGLTFLEDQDYKLSLSELLKALTKEPDSTRVRLALAYLYFRTGKMNQSLMELERILRAEPDNHRARVLRGAIHIEAREFKSAEIDYLYLLKENPESPALLFRLAQVYRGQGDPEKALQTLESILDTYPEPARVVREMVDIHVTHGAFSEAIALCDQQLEKNPDDLQLGLLKAMLLLHKRNYDVAEKLLSSLSQAHPHAGQPLVLMANLYMSRQDAKQDYGAALQVLKKAAEVDTENTAAPMNMAYIYKKLGDMPKAIECYQEVLKRDEHYVPAANDLAYLLAEQGKDLDKALELATRAHERLPNNPEVTDTLGWVYFKRGSLVLARRYLDQAIRDRPEQPVFRYHLGRVLHSQNDVPASARELREALKLGLEEPQLSSARQLLEEMKDPAYRFADIHRDLDQALQEQNLDRAMDLAQRARELIPDSADVADKLGSIYFKRGSLLLAKKHFREAIALAPANPVFHYHLGMVLYEERNYPEAMKSLEESIKLGLEGERASGALRLMEEMAEGKRG